MESKLINYRFLFGKRLTMTIMKIFIILLCTTAFSLTPDTSFSQGKVIIDRDQLVSIDQVFEIIKEQTEFSFFYPKRFFENTQKIQLKKGETTVYKLLEKSLSSNNISYEITEDKTILIIEKPVLNEVKKIQRIVTGIVSDETGQPIPGVSVLVKGTQNGTVSDFDGNFQLSLQEDAVIIFSYIGYITQELNSSATMSVVMKEDIANLEEVIVTGYGGTVKKDLVSAISQIKGEAISNQPASRVDNLLQGRAAGVEVTSSNGAPGSEPVIRIRGISSINGNNKPLYVIDGFIAGTSFNLSNINVNDIESIQVLKDASSLAIYGTRGAAGVVIINTKTGKSNIEGEVNVDVNHYSTFSKVERMPKIGDLRTYAEYWNEAVTFVPGPDGYGANDSSISLPYPDINALIPTGWRDIVVRNGVVENTDVTVSGNSKKSNFRVSFNKWNEEGVIESSGLTRHTVRANFDSKISSKFRTGLRLNISERNIEHNKININNLFQNTLEVKPIYKDDGITYTDSNPYSASPEQNLFADINDKIDHSNITNAIANTYFEYDINDHVTLRTTYGVDYNWLKRNTYLPSILPQRLSGNLGGEAQVISENRKSILNENTITYENSWVDSSLKVLVGWTVQKNTAEVVGATAEGFPNDVVTFNNLSLGSDPTKNQVNSSYLQRTFSSILTRINYSFKDKYLLTFAARNDGSSVFETGNKFAFFPSLGGAWKIDQEDFMKSQNTVSNLKLRASYGMVGEQGIPAYNSIEKYTTQNVFFNDVMQNAVILSELPSKNLNWEKTYQTDIGLEIGFLNNRFNLEIDYYSKLTKDLLLAKPLPGTAGGTRLENVGEIENKGFEIAFTSYNIEKNDFKWNSTLTLSSNKNKILNLGSIPYINLSNINAGGSGPSVRLIPGMEGPVFIGAQYLGTYKSKEEIDADGMFGRSYIGGPRYLDVDGNSVINELDFVTLGSSQPDFYGGLRNNITYKNWNLDVFIHGSYGNDILDGSILRGYFGRGGNENVRPEVKDRWTAQNPTSDIPRAGTTAGSFQPTNSAMIADGSFLRLKNVTLSYNFKPKFVKDATVYFSGNNLLLLTSFDWGDPEASEYGADALEQGVSKSIYPYSSSVAFGINIKL